jgi:two-component system nitrate/nitrite sensor histidine kinase NarX
MENIFSFILLSPGAMGFFPTLLMQSIILVALLFWKQKSQATWLLIGWQFSLLLFIVSMFAGLTIYAPLSGYVYWIGGISFSWLASILIIQFAYRVPRLLYPREAQVVLVLSLLLGAGLVTLMYLEASREPHVAIYGFEVFYYGILTTSQGPAFLSSHLFDVLYPLAFLWILFIWLRQSVHLSLEATNQLPASRFAWFKPRWWRRIVAVLWSPSTKEALTARMMALLFSMGLFSVVASILEERTILPEGSFATSLLVAIVAFVFTYLDYSSEPTSFKVKLVGISLATMMLLIGLIAPIMLEWTQQNYHEARREDLLTIKHLVDQNITDQMPPKVLYVATRPADSGLFASSYQMLFQRTPQVNEQTLVEQDARLHAMTMQGLNPFSWRHLLHTFPWLTETYRSLPASETIQRMIIPEGVVSYRGRFDPQQQHVLRYTFQLDEQTLAEVGYSYPAYRQMLHQRALPLVWLTVGAVLLFLLVVPFFIQVSLVRPLAALQEGVRRVEAGDLDVEVSVGVADEIGFLTGAFNRMVASLRTTQIALLQEIAVRQQKENELTTLTMTLEQRVADRTRALAALYDVSAIAGQSPDMETVTQKSLPRVLTAMQSSGGLLYMNEATPNIQKDATVLRLVASEGVPPHLLDALRDLPHDGGIGSSLLTPEKPCLLELSPYADLPLPLQQCGGSVLLTLPLATGNQFYGVMMLLRDSCYTPEEVDLAMSLADHLGKAAESHVLFQQTQRLVLLEERQRLARELHDSITQSLYGLVMLTEAGQSQVADDTHPVARHTFGRIGETARQVIKEIRLFIHQLRPSVLEQEGWKGAITLRLAAVEGRANVRTSLLTDETIRLSRVVEEALYHITQEALNNTLRHAQANEVTVALRQNGAGVVLEISDNGYGFAPDAFGNGGMGLENMRTRAHALGGTVEVISTTGCGTTVRVHVPGEDIVDE